MKKLIWKLYNENRISHEVALELLDKYYEQNNKSETMARIILAHTQKVWAFRVMKNIRYKIERKLDRYNHLMEFIRTLTGVTVIVLQLIIITKLFN